MKRGAVSSINTENDQGGIIIAGERADPEFRNQGIILCAVEGRPIHKELKTKWRVEQFRRAADAHAEWGRGPQTQDP